jgi:hypothetical protein
MDGGEWVSGAILCAIGWLQMGLFLWTRQDVMAGNFFVCSHEPSCIVELPKVFIWRAIRVYPEPDRQTDFCDRAPQVGGQLAL